jgi:hypothetical protein
MLAHRDASYVLAIMLAEPGPSLWTVHGRWLARTSRLLAAMIHLAGSRPHA